MAVLGQQAANHAAAAASAIRKDTTVAYFVEAIRLQLTNSSSPKSFALRAIADVPTSVRSAVAERLAGAVPQVVQSVYNAIGTEAGRPAIAQALLTALSLKPSDTAHVDILALAERARRVGGCRTSRPSPTSGSEGRATV